MYRLLILISILFQINGISSLTASQIIRNNRAPPDPNLPPANALPLIINPKFGNLLLPGVNIHNGYVKNNKDRNIGDYYVPFDAKPERISVQAKSINSVLTNLDGKTLDEKTTPSQVQLNANRIHCKLHTPLPDYRVKNAKSMLGKWYVQTEPGKKKGSPICEKVQFFPGKTEFSFQKVLETYILNDTWVTQNQNGTIVTPGKIMLEMKLVNGVPIFPRQVATYTLIDADPDNYITAFYCKKGQPSIPVLTRAKIPSMDVWNRVFDGVKKAGLKTSWLNLNCRPPILTDNGSDVSDEPLRSNANSLMF